MMMMMTLTCIFFTYMYIILRAYKHYVENKACLDVDDGGNEEAEIRYSASFVCMVLMHWLCLQSSFFICSEYAWFQSTSTHINAD